MKKKARAKNTSECLAHAVVIASPAKICSCYSHVKKVGICNSLATKIEPQEKFLVVFEVRVNLNTTTGWTTAAHSTGAMAAHGDLI